MHEYILQIWMPPMGASSGYPSVVLLIIGLAWFMVISKTHESFSEARKDAYISKQAITKSPKIDEIMKRKCFFGMFYMSILISVFNLLKF